jgi:hypothetical protein
MNLLLALAGQDQARILQWLLGYFGDADWRRVALLFPVTLLGAILFAASGRGLDAFSFGEDTARSVGVEVERFKAGVLALSALMTAVAVAVSGIIGFVGLVVPHIGRSLIGPPHRPLVPVAALLGATLTVLADLIARTLRPGEGLPVGVVTALLGAPFFCYLLRRQGRHAVARSGTGRAWRGCQGAGGTAGAIAAVRSLEGLLSRPVISRCNSPRFSPSGWRSPARSKSDGTSSRRTLEPACDSPKRRPSASKHPDHPLQRVAAAADQGDVNGALDAHLEAKKSTSPVLRCRPFPKRVGSATGRRS